MTTLQKLAIQRIKTLVQSIDVSTTAYALHFSGVLGGPPLTHEKAMEMDTASSKNYVNATTAQREAVKWVDALLEEARE